MDSVVYDWHRLPATGMIGITIPKGAQAQEEKVPFNKKVDPIPWYRHGEKSRWHVPGKMNLVTSHTSRLRCSKSFHEGFMEYHSFFNKQLQTKQL